MKKLKQQQGIGMIEIIVCLSIIVIAFWGFLELAKYNLKIQEHSKIKIEAINLASEAIEATRNIRNENWNNLASLSMETKYYPVISENKWALTLSDPGLINKTHNRWIILETVYRDSNDNISSSGTEDPKTKKITAFVEWTYRGKTRQINISTYLTNWNDE